MPQWKQFTSLPTRTYLDTIGMPETEYSAFMKYKEMKDKYDYMQNFDMKSKKDIALTVAVLVHLLKDYNCLQVLQFYLTFQDTIK